jgi:hypothetical protein
MPPSPWALPGSAGLCLLGVRAYRLAGALSVTRQRWLEAEASLCAARAQHAEAVEQLSVMSEWVLHAQATLQRYAKCTIPPGLISMTADASPHPATLRVTARVDYHLSIHPEMRELLSRQPYALREHLTQMGYRTAEAMAEKILPSSSSPTSWGRTFRRNCGDWPSFWGRWVILAGRGWAMVGGGRIMPGWAKNWPCPVKWA